MKKRNTILLTALIVIMAMFAMPLVAYGADWNSNSTGWIKGKATISMSTSQSWWTTGKSGLYIEAKPSCWLYTPQIRVTVYDENGTFVKQFDGKNSLKINTLDDKNRKYKLKVEVTNAKEWRVTKVYKSTITNVTQ